ncbi:MAG: methyl-accepting chemotaxis protein, partial [Woeseiaceae bacterium]
MASTTETSSIFRIVAILTALVLVAAAGLVFLQTAGGTSSSGELAALSQALPAQARAALAGTGGGFDTFDASAKRLADLRRAAGPAVPGNSAEWRELETRADSILSNRGDVESVNTAAAEIAEIVTPVLELSNELLDRAGSTAIIQEFQQRVSQLGDNVRGMPLQEDATATAAGVVNDAAFLRNVANALGGEDSDLDMAPLNDEDREALLVPLLGHLATIEAHVEQIGASASGVNGLGGALGALQAASTNIMTGTFAAGTSDSPLPAVLQNLWFPIGLVALAAVLVIVLLVLNSKSSVYESTARDQAEQNERNQQAILRLLDEMGSLADGDLTVEATVTEDITGTIADSFNYAIEELRKLVATVNETAIMVDAAAKQTDANAVHMAKAAENQTREISAATESIVSMAASIEEVSGNAERSSDVARHSVEVAHKGGEAVQRTIDGMNTIRETIQETS